LKDSGGNDAEDATRAKRTFCSPLQRLSAKAAHTSAAFRMQLIANDLSLLRVALSNRLSMIFTAILKRASKSKFVKTLFAAHTQYFLAVTLLLGALVALRQESYSACQ
jgi:hypothetical protein